MLGAAVGALTGVGIMYAGPALAVAGEQAGFEASFLMGTNALTVSTIPDIVTAGGMTLLATDGAYALNEINTMCTGQNLAVDTVFEGNEENYEACVVALQVLNDGLLDLTTRGYQRSGSGSSSSEAEKSDEGAEIAESGVNIRGAGDEGGSNAVIKNIQSKSPQQLIEDGWEDITNPKMAANTNSREFYDQKSGLKIRYDKGVDGENGFEAVDHYHVMNPNYTNKKVDYYLDIDGKPVGKGSKASHIVIKGEE